MTKIGTVNTTNREVFYLSTKDENWVQSLPKQSWLAFLIVDNKDDLLLDKVVDKCLDNNVRFACSVGQECEYTHDWFDEKIVSRRIEFGQPIETPGDFEDSPMTTWHNNFEEGLWFALIPANDGTIEITKVVCIDLTSEDNKSKLAELVAKVNDGWLPGD